MTSDLRLMCRDHCVAHFRWEHLSSRVVGTVQVEDGSHLPYGALGQDGRLSRATLGYWLVSRAIPASRPQVMRKLRALGFDRPVDVLTLGFGTSLSDQYWLCAEDEDVTWGDVSPFTNDFPTEFGEYLFTNDEMGSSRLAALLVKDRDLIATSPDASLGGNLEKRWTIEDGRRVLVKGGHAGNRFQEPFNEHLATKLGERLLDEGDFVTYELAIGGYLDYASLCGCMCSDSTELVSAYQLFESHQRRNDESLCSFFLRLCSEHGIDGREQVEKMLVMDFLICNFDRHWNNFGVLMDSETREWTGVAPLYDMGSSLWCDRSLPQGFGGYRMSLPGAYRPFRKRLDTQLAAFCDDMRWFDPQGLSGFEDSMRDVLAQDPFVATEDGRIDAICDAFRERVTLVCRHVRSLRPSVSPSL